MTWPAAVPTDAVDEDTVEFEPRYPELPETHTPELSAVGGAAGRLDRRDGEAYELSPRLHLAVEVALVTGRPLLLRGEPGSGKSALAPFVARRLGWRYYEMVVTSQTESNDLLWHQDAIRRLADAQVVDRLRPDSHYVEPGPLWWAFDRASALVRGTAGAPAPTEPFAGTNTARDANRAVVLIDEIDKAHPDVPNGLLVALGSQRFEVPYLRDPIERAEPGTDADGSPLVIVTTNEERDLPAAFVRRCVTHSLAHPVPAKLVDIARRHFDTSRDRMSEADVALARALAERIEALRADAPAGTRKPSTAEFLDAFRACRAYRIQPEPTDATWRFVEQLTLLKPETAVW